MAIKRLLFLAGLVALAACETTPVSGPITHSIPSTEESFGPEPAGPADKPAGTKDTTTAPTKPVSCPAYPSSKPPCLL